MPLDMRKVSEGRVRQAIESYLEGKTSLHWVRRTLDQHEAEEIHRVVKADRARLAAFDHHRFANLLDAYDIE